MQLIGSQNLRGSWGKVLDGLSGDREPIIIIRHSKPIAVLIGYEEWNSVVRRLSMASQEIRRPSPDVVQKIT